MKFCRDCKWVNDENCTNPKNTVQYSDKTKFAVTGIEQPMRDVMVSAGCYPLRQHQFHPGLGIELCGPDGKWWEAAV